MIVVTGAAGLIGSALVKSLNFAGISDILCVDKLGTDHRWKNLSGCSFADYMEKEDFIARVRGAKGLPKVFGVLHMGANSCTTERDVSSLMEDNFAYTRDLCLWSLKTKTRFIYASSAATYGAGENGYEDGHDHIEKLRPLNAYGFSKQMLDLWAKKHNLFDKIVGLKYFNVFGPGEAHKGEMRSMVLKSFEQIRETGKIKLFKSEKPEYKDGEQKRDFIYVRDAAAMTLWFLDKPRVNGLFNIGTGEPRTWNDLAKACFTALGKPVNIEYIPMPDSIKNQYQYYTKADIIRLRSAGCDVPVTPLDPAVADYWKSIQE